MLKARVVSPGLSGLTDGGGQTQQGRAARPAQNHGEVHGHLQADPVLQLYVQSDTAHSQQVSGGPRARSQHRRGKSHHAFGFVRTQRSVSEFRDMSVLGAND